MVDGFDELAARREALRASNGQFGAAPLHPPEMTLHSLAVPKAVEDLLAKADIAREYMSIALLEEIDATMPAEADFVNYEMNEAETHLIISEAIGGYGEELDRAPFAHIESTLVQLGQPYVHFDGDLVISSVDDYGWERDQPYSQARDAHAREAGEAARAQWRQAAILQQRGTIDAIWALVEANVSAIDLAWDEKGQCMRPVAVIHTDGRTDSSGQSWQCVCTLAAYLTEPHLAPMVRNDLSGLYRISRGA